jgi:hypothetical protein
MLTTSHCNILILNKIYSVLRVRLWGEAHPPPATPCYDYKPTRQITHNFRNGGI